MSDQLTVQSIRTTIFRLPLYAPLRWGKFSILTEVKHVLVHVRLSDGSEGVAEAPPRPTIYGETTESIANIISQINSQAAGRSPSMAMTIVNQIKNNHTALGAIDMAMQEAISQSKGVPLATRMGCTAEKLRVSYILGIGTLDDTLKEAERVYNLGVRVLKVKVGRNWEEDIERIKQLRQQFGRSLDLYADANECLTAADAPAKLEQLSKLGLLYCEEPLPIEQIQERAQLRRGKHLAIIADDSTFTLRDLKRELSLNTFDILNIKTARTGYTQSVEMLNLAKQANKGVMVGSQASSMIGTAKAALFAALPGIDYPSELSFYLNVKEDIVTHRPLIRDGYLLTADLARVTLDPDLLRAATVQDYD